MRTVIATGGALALVTLAACGGSGESASGSDEVTVWMYPVIADDEASSEFWEGVEADFEAEHEDIELDIELQPWEGRQEKVTTALASGSGPDIILLIPDQLPQYVEQDALLPVDEVVNGSEVELLPDAVEAMTVDGQVYSVPIYQTVNTTSYNTAVLEEAGISEPPTTWDEMLEAAPKLADEGFATLDYAGNPEETLNLTFYPLLWQAGGSVFSEDGTEVAFDGPEGVAALQFLLDLQEAGGLASDVVTKTSTFDDRGMPTGDAAMTYHTSLQMAERLAEAIGEDDFELGQPLEGPGGQAAFGNPGGLVLAQKAEGNEGARTFLSYMLRPDVLAGLASESGYLPPSEEVELEGAGEYASVFKEALPHVNSGEVHPDARQVMSILAAQIQEALGGDATAEEALEAAADEANALLDE
ncbi:ABC transporter substrate-binding protein [Phytoactinopolyspora halophila]|nr:extracellular solute-binding protein [Phytoactinopolyspora halophila]